MALTFWFDFTSSYSYLAAMRVEREADAARVPLVWQPFLLGPIFAEAGSGGSPNLAAPAKEAYMWRDIARRAAARGLPFTKPEIFPQRSVAPARATLSLPGPERPAFVRAVFAEVFGRGRNMADEAVLADAARAAGLEPERIAAGAADPDNRAALFAAVEEARRIGVFGAPSFVTSDGEIFWGDDRLADALAWERTGSLPAADLPPPTTANA